ncbi:MAG: Flagellar basal body rod protein FlgB [Fimbriimonadaceae bacterium]|nr:Flagellar basal body rod protein FlgB [Fimbriimonadaceae bacterium]
MREGNFVRILDNLYEPHLGRLQQSMALASKRQSLLTANLANVNTPGYKRQDMDFHLVLDSFTEKFPRLAEWKHLGEGNVTTGGAIRIDGNGVDMEREVVGLAETELRFEALTQATAGYFAGLKNVIREGR